MAKINYITVGTNDPENAKAFYDALLGTIGMKTAFDHPSGGRIYGGAAGMFGVLAPFDGEPACIGNGTMIGFNLDSPAEVDAFYAKAIALGGACAGAPGNRSPQSYFAYFRDPDGNKLCGYHSA